MAAPLRRLHHVSLQVSNGQKLAHDLVSKYKFNLFATRLTDTSRQVAFRKGSSVLVVNEGPIRGSVDLNEWPQVGGNGKHSHVPRVDLEKHKRSNPSCLYDFHLHHPVDSVSNVCFEVQDMERSFKVLHHLGCNFLVPPTTVEDENGLVTYSVLKSIVGNVCHTLIDKTKYGGTFLPGFTVTEKDWSMEKEDLSCPVTHFDHITYACPRKSTHQVMEWYEKLFGFQRFFIDGDEDVDDGFVVNQEGVGLRLTAMQYWKCSKAGISLPLLDKKEPDCKFVIAESLPHQGRNQVESFLEQHRGAGIQHIGLYTKNIVSTAHAMAEAGVQFFSPPPAYYTEISSHSPALFKAMTQPTTARTELLFVLENNTEENFKNKDRNSKSRVYTIMGRTADLTVSQQKVSDSFHKQGDPQKVGKRQEMEEAGHDPQRLSEHGILLDTDLQQDPSSQRECSENRRYLLQVFTKPLFAEDTFFLELIERRGATGFGEGNIRALWRSVQAYMENERRDSQGETVHSAQR